MRKGYHPKTSREKFPLSVADQQKLVKKAEDKEKSLLILMLSTGMHPRVLSNKNCKLDWTEEYFSWNRPKTHNKLRGSWSKAMKEGDNLGHLGKLRGKTPQRYWQIIDDLGEECGITGLCPLQLRHTYFVNLARLGHDAFSIAHGAATDLKTIFDYYTMGMNQMAKLTDEEREWLKWLMEV